MPALHWRKPANETVVLGGLGMNHVIQRVHSLSVHVNHLIRLHHAELPTSAVKEIEYCCLEFLVLFKRKNNCVDSFGR